jgi:hypothetical protein
MSERRGSEQSGKCVNRENGAKWEVAYRACGETAEEPSPGSNY